MMSHALAAASGSEVDVAIIGGGPAGCAAALTLCRYGGLNVAVIESSLYKQKRLGEVVSTGIGPLLQYLGLDMDHFRQTHITAHEKVTRWGSSGYQNRNNAFALLGSGWHLDRNQFDQDLSAAVISQGGDVMVGTKINEVFFTDHEDWILQATSHDGNPHHIKSRYLIDASGKKAALVRKLGFRHHIADRLVGIAAFFEAAPAQSHFFAIESAESGWWYSSRLPNNEVAVSFMTDADIAASCRLTRYEHWVNALKQTAHTKGSINDLSQPRRLHVRPAHTQLTSCIAGRKWIATGDAAISFDPLSSMGIGHAIASGIECGRVVYDWINGSKEALTRYRQTISDTYSEMLGRQQQFYGQEKRWSDKLFWQRRQC